MLEDELVNPSSGVPEDEYFGRTLTWSAHNQLDAAFLDAALADESSKLRQALEDLATSTDDPDDCYIEELLDQLPSFDPSQYFVGDAYEFVTGGDNLSAAQAVKALGLPLTAGAERIAEAIISASEHSVNFVAVHLSDVDAASERLAEELGE